MVGSLGASSSCNFVVLQVQLEKLRLGSVGSHLVVKMCLCTFMSGSVHVVCRSLECIRVQSCISSVRQNSAVD